MNEELSEKIADIQNYISAKGLTTMEMLVLVGFLQSQTYETLQDTIGRVKDL